MSIKRLSKAWPFDFVEIDWFDAESSQGWENSKSTTMSTDLCTSIGFLIKKSRNSYLLSMSIYFNESEKDHAFNNRQQIPKSMVKKFTVLIPKNTQPEQHDDAGSVPSKVRGVVKGGKRPDIDVREPIVSDKPA
jgi:hypothetical protein